MSPASFQFPVLVPQDCEGCGLCCEGIGSPVAIYTYRLSHAGGYLYRPPTLPEELGREIDQYFAGLKDGQEPLGHCLWFDPQTRRCKHHNWRPNVCRQYEVGCTACLDERRPYVTGAAASSPAATEGDVPQPDAKRPGSIVWLLGTVLIYLGGLVGMYLAAADLSNSPLRIPGDVYFAWLGFVFAFAPLLAIWCVLGPGSGFLRMASALVMLVGVMSVVPDFGLNGIVLYQAIAVAIPLAVMRSLGCSLGRPRSQGARRRRAQFTLAHLVLWTVGAALLLALGSYFQRAAPQQASYQFLLAVALSLTPWAALWAGMGDQVRFGRWSAVCLTCCVAASLLQGVERILPFTLSLLIVVIQTGIVAGVLVSARLAGVGWAD